MNPLKWFMPTPKKPKAKKDKRADFFAEFGPGPYGNGRGGFSGGHVDRATDEWRPGTIGPNRMIEMGGKTLRERAWDLYLNNPFASAVIDAYIANVIECGLMPERDDDWERAHNRWGGLDGHATRECDLSRDCTIFELQRLWMLELLVAGGCLTHYVTVDRRTQTVPLAIELIGEDRFQTHIQSYGSNPKTSNPVRNGFEIDTRTGRTVAWHVKTTLPNDLDYDPEQTTRIRRENGEYGYFKWKTGAKRGTTVLRSVIKWIHGLGYYADNEMFASNLKSSWAYMIKTSETIDADGFPDLADSSPETGTTDIYGNRLDKHEPGQVFRGYPGDEIEAVGPNVPQSESLPWIMMLQRSIAIGTGVSYEESFRDYTQGSWSSVRSAMASDRKRFRPGQKFVVNHFGNPTVRRFDESAVGAFHSSFPSPSQYVTQRDELLEDQEWALPGWESPNPKDDAAADDIGLKNGTSTHKDIQQRRGRSWRKHFAQMELEAATPGYPEQVIPGARNPGEPAEVEDDE